MIVVVIPAYNEERTIAKVVLQAKRHVDLVMVIDDGSVDMTGDIARGLGAKVLRNEVNLGKGEALRRVFKETLTLKPEVTVALDADGQHDPDEIPKLVKPIVDGEADVVVGSRYVEGASTDAPTYRKMGLRVIEGLGRSAIKVPIRDTQSGFRAYSLN